MRRSTQPFEFAEPSGLAEALALSALPGSSLFAGGCELVPAIRAGQAEFTRLVSIMRIPGLSQFSAHPKLGLEFGAQILIRRLAAHIWVSKRWAALHEAMEQIHPPHIANMGTVIGNLCAASSHHDLSVALMAHRAVLRISGSDATRDLSIENFYPVPGCSVLSPGEMVVSVFAPAPAPDAGSAFRKIAKAAGGGKLRAAAYVALDSEKENIVEAVVALAEPGAMPIRLRAVEAALAGKPAETESYAEAAQIAVAGLQTGEGPGDIVGDWARVLTRDVLEQAASRARSRHDPSEDAHLAY